MADAFIYDAVRTPRGRGKKDGALHTVRPVDLARVPLESLVTRNKLDTRQVTDVILGCVSAVGDQGGNIAKTAALYSGYDECVGGLTVNRFCGSGLEAFNQAVARIQSGNEHLFVTGGVESMSRVPIGSDGGAWSVDPQVATLTHFVPQGVSADLIATRQGYDREDVDRFALESQKRAAEAWEQARFSQSLIPVMDQNGSLILDRDEHMRPETTLDSLSSLKPAFKTMGEDYGFNGVALQKYPQFESIRHLHHAGNSSGIVDGAAAILVGSAAAGKEQKLHPRARVVSYAVTSTEPTIMLTGPGPASALALKRAGLTPSDIDLYEVNEAFASVVMNFMDELEVPHDKVNVNGGAIAMGHPLGATGAIILGTLLDELERQDKKLGLATLCIGGGMGIATIIERI